MSAALNSYAVSDEKNVREIFIGRQPILDRNRRTFAYELLFRDKETSSANISNPSKATAKVIMQLLIDIGIENLVGKKPAFVNVNEEIMNREFIELLPPQSTVFEILETTAMSEGLTKSLHKLKRQGYTFALDDFILDSSLLPLTHEVNFVKLDVKDLKESGIERTFSFLRSFPVRIIAEKVENEKEFKYLYELGFHLFQGYFFSKPELLKRTHVSSERTALMEILRLIEMEKETFVIESHLRRHPALTYKLLQYINSAFFYVQQKIRSITHAVSLLGYNNVKRWVLLLLFAAEDDDPISNPLFERAFVRGYMMEKLSKMASIDKPLQDSAFITGCFSIMDVLLGMSLAEIVGSLSLSNEIIDALLFETGSLGILLRVIKAHESSSYDETNHLLSKLHLNINDVFDAEMEAILSFHKMAKDL